MASFNYSRALYHYEKCTGLSAATAKSLKKLFVKHGLDKVTSCLSIGPGHGDTDVPLIQDCMPGLKVYYGVEPSADSLSNLKDRLAKTVGSQVQVNLIQKGIEEWEGPPKDCKFDLILAVQVLYYIKDKQKLFKQLMEWLNPGGLVIIAHCAETFNCDLCKEFGIPIDVVPLADGVEKELKESGIEFWAEEPVYAHFDLQDPQLPLMEFSLQREVQENEVDNIKAIIKKLVPSGFLEKSEKTAIFIARA